MLYEGLAARANAPRCQWCAWVEGHSWACPSGYPSKHPYKRLWFLGNRQGNAGKLAVPGHSRMSELENTIYTMGWIAGAMARK